MLCGPLIVVAIPGNEEAEVEQLVSNQQDEAVDEDNGSDGSGEAVTTEADSTQNDSDESVADRGESIAVTSDQFGGDAEVVTDDDPAKTDNSDSDDIEAETQSGQNSSETGDTHSNQNGVESSDTQSESASNETPLDVSENLRLILGNSGTRNSRFDSNAFADVPMDQIPVDDLIVDGDLYNEVRISTQADGVFRVKCEVSHFAYDDPIVFPDQPGKAHLHMFFGNTKANAYSTFDSLMNTGTGSCNGEDLNRSAYWVPAMLDQQGDALVPMELMVYYKNTWLIMDGKTNPATAFPDNLQIVSGDAKATAGQTTKAGQNTPQVSYGCGGFYRAQNYQSTIPSCGGSDFLEMRIAFPPCWNPNAGTYSSTGDHLAYPDWGFWFTNCPDSHPVKLPSTMYRLFFAMSDYGSTDGWFLSSDRHGTMSKPGGTTTHADWFGAWNAEVMDMWINNCTNTPGADCEVGLVDLSPTRSLVPRKQGYYQGQRIPAEELAKLCPQKTWDGTAGGVANCL